MDDVTRPLTIALGKRKTLQAYLRTKPVSDFRSFLYTLHLFTASDLKTMLLPVTVFGILSALSSTPFTSQPIPILHIMANLPALLSWLWPNILILSISNQREPEGIVEDKLNKPWRPIASGRITPNASRKIQLWVVPRLVLLGNQLGILTETLACLVGNWFYNDLGGADEHFLVRNVVNGVAYLAYGLAALKLAAGCTKVGSEFYAWLWIIAFVVSTTIQLQDLKDLEGDRARGRHTMPVVLGAVATRASVCAGVLFWSVFCTVYWDVSGSAAAAFPCLGLALVVRVCACRNAKADRTSFVLWSWWVMAIFALPLARR